MDEIIGIRDNAGDGVAKSISFESIRNLNGVEIKQTQELLLRSMRQLHTTVERLKEQILEAGRLMNV